MTLVKAESAGVEAEAMVNADGVDDAGRDAAAPAVGPTFEDVYRRSYRRMTKVAHLMVGDSGVAEEIVQDAFVGLYRRFDAVADHDGYLYRSVVNGCRSRFRRKQVDERVRDLRVVTEVGPPEIDETWRALARLSERRRAVVVLRYYADLSEADVARSLGVRPGTVKSLLHRALAQLRDVINR